MQTDLSMRSVIKAVGGAAFVLAFYPLARNAPPVAAGAVLQPNAFLEISPPDRVTLWLKKCEMGQHIHSALAAIAADELGADMAALNVKQADTDARFGFVGTGGSYAVAGFWRRARPLFAAARDMLETAAAAAWDVGKDEVKVAGGVIRHAASGRRAPLGEFAAAAARLAVPEQPRLRSSSEFLYIGKVAGHRDVERIVNGSARYGIDVRMPNMRFAAIARSPVREGVLEGFERRAALAVPGVQEVFAVGDWIAVVAASSWAAQQGRERLRPRWRYDRYGDVSSDSIRRQLRTALGSGDHMIRQQGEAIAGSRLQRLQCDYEMPLAQHAALEPVNATALVEKGRCTIWGPIHLATQTQGEVARALQIAKENVSVHTTLVGGSFGRKLERDFVIEAAQIAARVRGPVQLLYTREDDMMHGGMRPPSQHRLSFSFDRHTRRFALDYDYAAASAWAHQDRSQLSRKGYDWAAALGAVDIPYAFQSLRVRQTDIETPAVRLNWWRGTYRNNHAFASECAMDELAAAAGLDPLELRLSLLSADLSIETFPDDPAQISAGRLRRVLALAAEKIAYRSKRGTGRAVGIACHCYSDVHTYIAHAVDVTVRAGGVRIHKVVAAVDCGIAISPDSVTAQVEGSVVFGLNSALWDDVDVQAGQVMSRNFDHCRLLRLHEMPQIDVHIVASEELPGGIGEPPLPPVIPAFLNAVARAGGPRVRRLPAGDQLELV